MRVQPTIGPPRTEEDWVGAYLVCGADILVEGRLGEGFYTRTNEERGREKRYGLRHGAFSNSGASSRRED